MSDIGRVTKITKLKINFGNINNDMKQRSKTGFECNKYAFDSLDSLVTSAIIEAVLWHQECLTVCHTCSNTFSEAAISEQSCSSHVIDTVDFTFAKH